MDLFILVTICITNILLGVLVLARDPKAITARIFFLIILCITAWVISNSMTNDASTSLVINDITNRIAFVSGYACVLSALLFTYFFPKRRRINILELIIVGGSSIIILILSSTRLVAGEVSRSPEGTLLFSTGPLAWVFIVGYLGVIILLAKNLLKLPKNENKAIRHQARLVAAAFFFSAIFGLLFNVIIPIFDPAWDTTRLGPFATLILVGMIAYTIVRHGLFDMRLAVVRLVGYIFSIATLAVVYFILAYTISILILHDNQSLLDQSPVSIALALLIALLFQPARRFFDHLTDKIFYQSNYDINDFIIRLSRKLTLTTDLRSLLERAGTEIADTLRIEQAFFTVYTRHDHVVSAGTHKHTKLSDETMDALDNHYHTSTHHMLIAESLDDDGQAKLKQLLRSHKIAAVLPLLRTDETKGYLFLGNKLSGYYVYRDIRALTTIRDELVIAIQNALSVEEVRDFNATLKQGIDDATEKLRASNLKLQRLDEAKDEFVSMASHQLRTPLTSVKGYISMVLEGDAGKITKNQRQLLSEAFTSSERMVHLIGDFLNVSRLQTGKFMIDSRPVNLAKIVDQEVDSLRTTATSRTLKLRYHQPSYFPTLYLDEAKIRQVVMNFIDNAIYYSHENGNIDISLNTNEGYVELRVHDNGIGVPFVQQSHLFTKFFRADNARKQRPDGTGVGLFLSKKVIDAHGGTIIFESVQDEGSTFGFRLPVKKLSSESTD